jgi:hypothetical protein
VLTYKLLLHSTKENFKDYQKASDLKTFIKLWIEETSGKEYPDIFSSPGIVNDQLDLSPTNQEENLAKNLFEIISLSFNTNIAAWNSQYLYEIIIELYDEYEFEP